MKQSVRALTTVALAALGLGTAALAPQAAGAAPFSPAQRLSGAFQGNTKWTGRDYSIGPVVDVAPSGAAAVAALVPHLAKGDDIFKLWVATRSPSDRASDGAPAGGFQTVSTVTTDATEGHLTNPEVHVDDAGNATVKWYVDESQEDYYETYRQTYVAYKPDGGTWQAPQALGGEGTASSLVMRRDGSATIIGDGWSAERPAGGSTFTETDAPSGSWPTLVGNARGDLALALSGPRVYVKPAGGSWSKAASVGSEYDSQRGDYLHHDLAITDDGHVVLAWTADGTIAYGSADAYVAVRSPGNSLADGTWGEPQRVSPEDDGWSAYLTHSTPNAVDVHWYQYADQAWHSAPVLGPALDADRAPALALTTTSSGGSASISAAFQAAGTSAFGPLSTVFSTATDPDADDVFEAQSGTDGQGNGFVSWVQQNGVGTSARYQLAVSAFDPVAPVLAAPSIPGNLQVGAAGAFGAQATDRMSAPAIAWDFGDGSTGGGGSASHAYGAAGTYTVTVTATDAAGNVAKAMGRVTVTGSGTFVDPGQNPGGGGGGGGSGGGGTTTPVVTPQLPLLALPISIKTKSASRGRTLAKSLAFKLVQPGDVIAIGCQGTGCSSAATQKLTVKKASKKLTVALGKKGVTLSAKAVLTVTVTRAGSRPQTLKYTMVKGRVPRRGL